mgnify:CR=1 FL=1
MPEEYPIIKQVIESLRDHNKLLFHFLNNQDRDFNLESLVNQCLIHFDFPLKTWFYYPKSDDMQRDLKKFDRVELAQEKLNQYKNSDGNLQKLLILTLETILLDHIERAYHDKCKTPSRSASHMAARIRMHGSGIGYWEKIKKMFKDLYNEQPPALEEESE